MRSVLLGAMLAMASILHVPFSAAQDVAPDVLLKGVTAEVTAIIRQDADIQAGHPAKVADLIETRILPLFDFRRMTRITMARNWRLATPEQQEALTAEYKTLLVRTYSAALSSYRNQVIEFSPLRVPPDATEVTVRSVVREPGKERMSVDYDMEKTAKGWMVYDIRIAGVSLVSSYRDSFASRVRDGGIDGLIRLLADKNRQGDSRTRSQLDRSHQSDLVQMAVLLRSMLHGGAR